jgi:UDP-N-acetylmuramoyl-tripeptide--D-alanyl-D-alanine ligase
MSFWSSENLRKVVGGSWLSLPAREASGLSTDTRTLAPGQVFLALAGDRFDGNEMVGDAAGKGSPVAIIDNSDKAGAPPAGMGVLRVGDTKRALLKLGAAYRKTLESTRVIAVAGSNGKTTTVRLIDAVLGAGAGLRGSCSQKSFNNHIGVPLTILAAKPGDQYLICEVGTNAPGEISLLAEVVQPDIAVITSIGREHLEKLGSLRGVAREEASVLEYVRSGGAGIVNADSPDLMEAVRGEGGIALARRQAAGSVARLITFGESERADVRVVSVEQSFAGVRFALNDRAQFTLPLLGRHNAANAAAAVAVARRMSLGDRQIAAGLAAVRGPEMRLERVEVAGVRIVNDAYNANPDSMKAALDAFGELAKEGRRRIVVLGDMLELGEHSDASHREIGDRLARTTGLDLIVLVGNSMKLAAERLGAASDEGRVVRVPELGDARAGEVAALLKPGDLVLLKGSRRMRLERLVAALRALDKDAGRGSAKQGKETKAPAA